VTDELVSKEKIKYVMLWIKYVSYQYLLNNYGTSSVRPVNTLINTDVFDISQGLTGQMTYCFRMERHRCG